VTETIAGVTLPSVLLVQGAWHTTDHFCPLVDELSGEMFAHRKPVNDCVQRN
jgi:hypothetical protein